MTAPIARLSLVLTIAGAGAHYLQAGEVFFSGDTGASVGGSSCGGRSAATGGHALVVI